MLRKLMLHVLVASLVLKSMQRRSGTDKDNGLVSVAMHSDGSLDEKNIELMLRQDMNRSGLGPATVFSDRLDMQEAGFRLLNGAARWVFRRFNYPPKSHLVYDFNTFTKYVMHFVQFWVAAKYTPEPACEHKMGVLFQLMKDVRKALCDADLSCKAPHGDGIVKLPKLSTDVGFVEWATRLGTTYSVSPDWNKLFPLGVENGMVDCATLDSGNQNLQKLAKLFCAPASTRSNVGWRFWWDEWFPTLVDALSCGMESDAHSAEFLASWAWVGGDDSGAYRVPHPREWHWDVYNFIQAQNGQENADTEIVKKAWRLSYRHLTKPENYRYERPGQYHQKELSRYVPFVGEFLNRAPPSCTQAQTDTVREEMTSGCNNPQLFTLFSYMSSERQPWYGAHTWRFFHTAAEVIAKRDPESGEILDKYKKFMMGFALMHPCPHCRKHLLTKVQLSDMSSYNPALLPQEHPYRVWTDEKKWWQESAEWMMYPLEWLTIVQPRLLMNGQCAVKHVWGACSGSHNDWRNFIGNTNPGTATDLQKKLVGVTNGAELRMFLWKMHNAVDSTIESKHEERVAPWSASYWPVSVRYQATEPWGQTGQDWHAFPVQLVSACNLELNRESPHGGRYDGTLYEFGNTQFRTSEWNGLQSVDNQYLVVLRENGPLWRHLWMAFHKLVRLIQNPEESECARFLQEAAAVGNDAAFPEALMQAIDVKGVSRSQHPCQGENGVMTVESTTAKEAVAHWMGNWKLWKLALMNLEMQIECVANFVRDSNLLQTRYSFA